MSKRSVGVLLGLIVFIAAGTLFQDFRFDESLSQERAAAVAADREIDAVATLIADLRTAQGGYVAPGQAPASWLNRGAETLEALRQKLAARKSAAPNADAVARYDSAAQAIEALATVDGKARASIQLEDKLHAADLIYIDGQQAADTAANQLAAARALEAQAAESEVARLAMYRLAMNAGAIVLISLGALYFGRALSIVRTAPPASTAQMIRDLPPPVKGATSLGISTAAPAAPVAAQPAPAPVAATQAASPIPRPVSLSSAAELCVDLARVLDGRDVPGLLERTAGLLDAKGIMIWAVDAGGAMLRPAMCHGYSDKVLARIRPLQVDADNVTSLAYRSLQAQAVPGASVTDPGAVAVPLITASGCVGVLAAEVKQSRPHPDLLPVARIIAAQFTALVAPVEAQPATAQG